MTDPITVRLTSYNMGDETTARDFEYWYDFVAANLETAVGFPVSVDHYRYGESASRNYVSADATSEQEDVIRAALREIWEDFCNNGAWDAAARRT